MAAKKTDYSQLSDELEAIVARLQDDNTSIEEALQLYERGAAVAKVMAGFLKTAENRVKQINSGEDQS